MTGIKSRPTLYKGIRMRSRLEADFARYLDAMGSPWAYEPDCFAAESGQWLPDFRTVLPTVSGGYRTAYLELKPEAIRSPRPGEDESAAIGRVDVILRQMSVAWASEPSAALELVFWSFGGNGPAYAVFGIAEWPWMAWDGADRTTPWPGMGQTSRRAAAGDAT